LEIGYARVSTTRQSLTLQVEALQERGLDERHIFQEKISAAERKRPELERMLKFLQKGDTLVVWKIDRLGRSLEHLLKIVNQINSIGVTLVSLTENVDTSTEQGKFLFNMFATVAEYERGLINERRNAGLQRAKERGVHCGRKRILSLTQRNEVRRLYKEGRTSKEIEGIFRVSRFVIAGALKENLHTPPPTGDAP